MPESLRSIYGYLYQTTLNLAHKDCAMALMLLTTVEEGQAPEEARYLLARSQRETTDSEASRAIMEMVTTTMVYKFVSLNRVEVEAMMGIRLQETRVYQEAQPK